MSVTFESNVLDLIPWFLLSLHHLYLLLLTTTTAQVAGASLTETNNRIFIFFKTQKWTILENRHVKGTLKKIQIISGNIGY